MSTRQRFRAVMNFEPFDRLPILEWAMWWDLTIARWRTEGLPSTFSGPLEERYEIAKHFGQDLYLQDWLWGNDSEFPQPKSHGAAIIHSMDEYEEVLPHLYSEPERNIDKARWSRWAEMQKQGDAVVWLAFEGFFWFPRRLLGIEPHLYAFYDAPELMHRINADLAEWMIKCLDVVCAICIPDFLVFAEDMSYNNGPMISEGLFKEFIAPYYARITPALKERGIISIADSDGDVTDPAWWFERAGIDGMLPLERQAGVDIARLRKEHPRMRFVGHFDKMTMNRGEEAMRAEFERLLPVAARGGYIIGVDHQTPPGVSYQHYLVFMSLFREYAEKAGALSRAR
jgi:hypothetical protein